MWQATERLPIRSGADTPKKNGPCTPSGMGRHFSAVEVRLFDFRSQHFDENSADY